MISKVKLIKRIFAAHFEMSIALAQGYCDFQPNAYKNPGKDFYVFLYIKLCMVLTIFSNSFSTTNYLVLANSLGTHKLDTSCRYR